MPTLGVISDTHGLLRPQAIAALRGVQQIIHAGDIGKPEVLAELAKIAPVTAVRGNNDQVPWAGSIKDSEMLDIAGHRILVIHDLSKLEADPVAEGLSAVISGHSHRPKNERRDGVLFLNPGSAGPRRFKLPVSLALLRISARKLQAEIVELPI